MQRLSLGILLAIAALGLAAPAAAQPTLEATFGGPNGFGTQCLSPNDDSSSALINLAPAFPSGLNFFGTRYMSVYVNTNGNITFGDPLGDYTPNPFPVAGQPMIAAYWADVDIRGTACSGFSGSDWTSCMLAPGDENGVYWALEPRRMVITWDHVGYFSCNDELQMTFQMILTAADGGCGGAGDFDVEFRYTQCGWNTGEASGGEMGFPVDQGTTCTSVADCDPGASDYTCEAGECTIFGFPTGGTCTTDADCVDSEYRCEGGQCWLGVPAQAGFDAGNRSDYVEILGSRTNAIHTILCETSNVDEIGVWRFQIRSGAIICPGAGDECATGLPGVCADGRTRCVADTTECRPLVDSTAETCDGLDNDCDGMVDDGSLCPGASTCVMGTCVATCFEGVCPTGLVCETATERCVEDGCVGITCPAGQRCTHGVCGDSCAGIVCPFGLSCESGRCVDLCAGASCDDCNVCDPATGSCAMRCTAMTCPAGSTCAADGTCVDDACASVTCATGTHCDAGTCVDDCEGTLCPTGQECIRGECEARMIDAGMRPDASSSPDAGAGNDAGLDAGMSGFDAGPDACMTFACMNAGTPARRGCACAVPGAGEPGAPAAGAAFLAAGLALVFARRRR